VFTGAIPTLNSEQPDPSSATTPSQPPLPTQLSAPTVEEAAMLSALSAPSAVLVEPAPVAVTTGGYDDIADNGSSSLSELGDASDDQSEPTPRPTTANDIDDDDDSEAETERLEETPRKLARTATDTSLAEALYTRTPSKLMHSRTVDQDESAPPTPSVITDVDEEEAPEADNPLHSLSLIAASEAASLEHAGKKRKRTSAEGSPVHEEPEEDEPARKRTGSAKLPGANGLSKSVVDSGEQVDVEEELEVAEERLSQLAHEEMDLEERQANIAAETVGELATVAKLTKPRKGGRRGKRKAEDPYAFNDNFAGTEAQDAEGEEEHDEEHSAALDEEVAKKKNAIDELAKIEKKFKLFREK
jgi:hypothetical protein